MCACPERTIPLGRTRCEENSEEYRSDVGRSLLLFGFPTQTWRSVACSWLHHHRSCFLHMTHRMFRAKFLAESERSVSSSSAAGVDTTSTQARFSEIVQLACCDVHVRNSPPSVSQAQKGVDDGGAAASVVSSRGVCGGVVSVKFTMMFPLYVMFPSLPKVFTSK